MSLGVYRVPMARFFPVVIEMVFLRRKEKWFGIVHPFDSAI